MRLFPLYLYTRHLKCLLHILSKFDLHFRQKKTYGNFFVLILQALKMLMKRFYVTDVIKLQY